MTSGWRRALRTPLILLGVNLIVAVLAVGIYGYAGSQAALRDQLASARRDLNDERNTTVGADLAYVEANHASYERLLERGLLRAQDRLAAAELLERLRARHGVNGIRYRFSPQHAAPLGQGRLARTTLLSTDVTIDMTGVTDLDLLAFARSVIDQLPGNVRVIGLRLQRRFEAGPGMLARLRAGVVVDLVEGRLQLEWRALRARGLAPASS